MLGSWPQGLQGQAMGGAAVALVAGQVVTGVAAVETHNQAIAPDLSQNTGSGNFGMQAIALHHRLLRKLQVGNGLIAVH